MSNSRWLMACLLGTTMLLPVGAGAQTWVGTTGTYADSANWNPAAVPSATTATATFTSAGTSAITIGGPHHVGTFVFDNTAQAYTFTFAGGASLAFWGVGVTNNSGKIQSFVLGAGSPNISFNNSATAADAHFTLTGGILFFNDTSNAGTAVIDLNGGVVQLADTASLANAKVSTTNGNVILSGSSTGGQAQLSLGSGTLLAVQTAGATAAGSVSGAGTIWFGTNVELKVGGNGLSTTFSGKIDGAGSGRGSILKEGNGTWTLTGGDHTYAGSTTISGGRLVLSGAGDLANSSGIDLTNFTASFDISAASGNRTIKDLSGVDGSQVTLGSHTLTVGTANNTTFEGLVTGLGGLTKQGSGKLTLTGSNFYIGATTIDGGTLALSGFGDIDLSSGVNLTAATAVFDISAAGGGRTVNDLAGIAGSKVILGGNTLTAGASGSTTFAGTIEGTGGLVKQGSGTLTLTGPNTYSDGTTINGGTLEISSTDNLGDAGSALAFGGGALRTTANLTNSRATTLNGGGGTFDVATGTTLTQDSVIDGSGGLTKTGGGTLVLSVANTYGGGTTINAGIVSVSSDDRLGNGGGLAFGGGTLRTTASFTTARATTLSPGGGTFETGSGTTLTYVSKITGIGGLTKAGAGTLVLANFLNDYQGGTTINEGTLSVSENGNLGQAGAALTFGGGTLQATVTGFLLSRPVTLNAGGGTFETVTGVTLNLNGVVSGDGRLTKTGAGTLFLGLGNTYRGGTAISAGTLAVSADASLGDSSGNLIFDGGTLRTGQSFATSRATTLNIGGGTFEVSTLTTLTHNGVVDGIGGLTKTGGGTLTLSNVNTYGGPTVIAEGTVALSGSGSIASSSDVSLGGPFARFDISGSGADVTIQGLSGVAGSKVTLGARTLTVVTPATTTFSGIVEGSGGFTKLGTGALTFAGVNTYSGATTITGGTLALAGAGSIALSSGVNLTDAAARFDISGSTVDQTIGDLSGVTGSKVLLGNNSLTVGTANSTIFSGTVEGNGGFAKQGSGTLTLEGANTYAGGTTIKGGVLAVSNDGNLGSATGGLSFDGGTLKLLSGFNLATTRGITLGAGGGTIDTNGSDTTITQGIFGTGGLTKMGGGTLTLEGGNAYGGRTTIGGGALVLTGTSNISASSGVDLTDATARFDIAGSNDQTIQDLSGVAQSKVILGANSLTVGTSNSATFSGIIEGSGGLTKQGTGTQTLAGDNTYSGATTINGGTLALAGAGNIASSSGVSLADPTSGFDISGSNGDRTIKDLTGVAHSTISLGTRTLSVGTATSTTFQGVIQGDGGLTKQGSGTLTLQAESTYSGATTINQGTLKLSVDGAIANSSVVTVAAGATFDVGNSISAVNIRSLAGAGIVELDTRTLSISEASTEFSGVIRGDGNGVMQIAGGTLTLSGASTYEKITHIVRGATLALKGTGSIQNSDKIGFGSTGSGAATFDISQTTAGASVFRLDDSAGNGVIKLGGRTLTLTNGASTFNGVVEDGGLGGGLVLAASTELSLGGVNTYTGTTTIGANAALRLTGAGSIAPSGVDLAGAGATLDIAGASGNRTIGDLAGAVDSKVILGANSLTAGTSNSTTFRGVVEGNGGLVKQGGGVLTLEGVNTYAGATTVDGGTLALANGGAISSSSVVTISSGATLNIGSNNADSSIRTLAGAGTVQLGARKLQIVTGSTEFSGTITNGGNGGSLEILGGTQTLSGTIDLPGSTIFLGPVAILGGTLALKGAGSMANAGVDFSGVGTAIFDISQTTSGASVLGLIDSGGAGGIVALGSKELKITGYSPSFGGVIQDGGIGSGTGGSLRIASSGVQTLNGANTYTGATTVDGGGFLYLAGSGSIATSSSLTLLGNAFFNVTGIGTPSATVQNLSGDANATISLGSKSLTVVSSADTTFSGTIDLFGGTGGLAKQGAAKLTLAGVSRYIGETKIDAGILALTGNADVSGSSVVTIGAGATFDVSASTLTSVNVQNLAGSGAVQLGNNQLAIMNASGEFAGAIIDSGSGGLQIWGGALTLTGASTYRGTTQISPGATLALKGTGSILSTSPVSFSLGVAQAIFDISQTPAGASVGSLAATGRNGTVNLGGRTLTLTIGASAFNGVLKDDGLGGGTGGGLTLAGNAQQGLGGTNTYTGATTIGAGAILKLIVTGSIATSSIIDLVGTGATLDISGGNSQTVRDLQGVAGSIVTLGNRTLTVGTSNSTTFAGVIGGTGGLTKQGSGTLTLTGNNGYTGLTTVSAGILRLGNNGASGMVAGDVAVSAGAVLAFNRSDAIIFAGNISGGGAVAYEGPGTVTLTGASTYTGGTAISGTTVEVGSDAALGATNAALMLTGGTIQATASFTSARRITLSGTGGTVDTNGNVVTLQGIIDGGGRLTKDGAGTLILGGANTYSGGTTVSGGVLQGTASSLQGDIVNNAAVVFDQSAAGTYAGAMSGSGSLTKIGNGALTLTGANTHGGGTTIGEGILRLGVGGSLAATGALAVNGGTFDLNGNSQTVGALSGTGGTIALGSGTLTTNSASNTALASAISGSGGLVKQGSGTLTLTGANGYTGGTTVDGGTLRLGAGGSLASGGALTVNGGTFDLNGSSQTVGALSGTGGAIALGNGTLTADSASSTTLAAAISGDGAVVKQGTGMLTLTAANGYTGGTTINEGTLQLGAGGSLAAAGALTINGGTFDLNGNNQTVGALSGTGGAITLGGGTLTADSTSNTVLASAISGGGNLVKQGGGTLVLTANSSYVGVTTVSGGVLQLGNGGTSGMIAGDVVVATDATLAFNRSDDITFAGNISGAGAVAYMGPGIVTLTGTNTYAGGTAIAGGVVQAGSDDAFGTAGTKLIFVGGTLQATASFTSVRPVVLNSPGGTFDTNGNQLTLQGAITGVGALTKAGTGTLVLEGPNTYSGGTTVSGGTLTGSSISLQGAIVNNATVAFAQASDGPYGGIMSGSGALVKSGAGNLTLTGTNSYTGGTMVSGGTLTGNTTSLQGTIVNNATVAFAQASDGTYGGSMSGNGTLTKSGSGNLTLSGANSYSGGTTVSSGTLTGSTTSLQGAIVNNATVAFAQASDGTYGGAMSGSGALEKSGAGNLVLSSVNSYTGGTTVSGGTLTGNTTSLQGNILNNAAVVFDQASDGTYAGALTGTGSLTKSGAGLLYLTGPNTYSGGTTVSGGVLQGTTSSLQGQITNNAAVLFDQTTDGSYAGTMSGTGSLTKSGTGVVTFTGANTYTGGTTVTEGTLKLAEGSTLAETGALTVNGGTFDLNGNVQTVGALAGTGGTIKLGNGGLFVDSASDTTLAAAITGDGVLVKLGSGTLTLTGAADFVGRTTVREGTLRLGTGGSLGTGSALTINGGTFDLNGNVQTIGALAGAGGTLALGGGTLTARSASSTTLATAITGSGSFVKQGTGTLTLTGANIYTGGTTVGAGTLRLGTGGSLASGGALTVTGGTFDLNGKSQTVGALSGTGGAIALGGGTLTTDSAANTVLGSAISGSGKLVKTGSGTLTLTGANSYTGGTTVSGGTLIGTTTSLKGDVVNDATVAFDQAGDGIYAGTMTGSGKLVKTGGGTVVLTGSNSYGGGTRIDGGILQLGDGGTTGMITGNVEVNGAGSMLAFHRADDVTFGGDISGSGSLLLMGSGKVALTGNNSFTGGTVVGGGVVQAADDAAFGAAGGRLAVAAGATVQALASFSSDRAVDLRLGGGKFDTNGNTLTLQGTISGNGKLTKIGEGTLVLTGTNSYTGGTTVEAGTLQGNTASLQGDIVNNAAVVFDQGSTGTYAGVMSGSGGLAKTGSGTLTLTGASTYTGGTTVNQGTLQLGAGGALASGGALAVNGGTFDLNGNDQTVGALSGTGGAITLGGGTLTTDSAGNTTLAAAISGSGGLVKQGSGTLALTGANTYTGGTTINGGVLQLGTGGSLASVGALTVNDGTFDLNGNNQTVGALSGTGGAIALGGGTLTADSTGSTALAAAISGSGGLVKQGSGTLSLTGANSYTGGTTINGGVLQLGIGGSLAAAGALAVNGGTFDLNGNSQTVGTLSGTGGAIALGSGTLTTNSAADAALASAVSGSGGLVKQGAGNLTLTGANSYTGGTTVLGGTLTGSTTSLQGAIVNNATVAFAQASDGTYGGSMSGSGALVKSGAGNLTLTGANSYSGGTTVSGGTLTGTTSSLQGTIVNNAMVAFAQASDGTYGGAMSGSGALVKSGAGNLVLAGANSYTGGTTVSGGTLTGNSTSLQGNILNNAAVVFDQANDGTYAGNMTGTGSLTKSGTGLLSLTGTNVLGGGTTVSGGVLAVNGSLTSNVTVINGGALGGSGQLIGALAVNGGTLAPGNSIGTMNVTGNFSQTGGVYQVEANAQGQSDKIVATGTATIGGGATVQVVAASGAYQRNTTYTILSATGGLTGTYGGVTANLAFLTPSLSYDANNVYLLLEQTANAFAAGAQTRNEYAVGTALDIASPTATGDFSTVLNALAGLTTQQGPAALNAISGQPYTGFGSVNIGASLAFMNTLGQQIAVARGGGIGTRVALAEACVIVCDTAEPPKWGAWISGLGGFGSIGGNANAGTLTYNLGGVAAGVDYRLDPRFLVGLAVGYSSGRQWVNGFQGTGNTDNYSAALYASFTQGGFYADALAGYAYSDNRQQRVMQIPGLSTRYANGGVGANQFLGQIEAGYRIGLIETAAAQASITPFARFQTVAASQNAFSESGAQSLNLNVAQQNTTSLRTVIGADVGVALPAGLERPLDVTLRLGWAHEYADTARPMTAAFAGAPTVAFTVYGAQPLRDAAVIGLGVNARIGASTSIYARYDGEITGRDDSHVFSAGLRMTW